MNELLTIGVIACIFAIFTGTIFAIVQFFLDNWRRKARMKEVQTYFDNAFPPAKSEEAETPENAILTETDVFAAIEKFFAPEPKSEPEPEPEIVEDLMEDTKESTEDLSLFAEGVETVDIVPTYTRKGRGTKFKTDLVYGHYRKPVDGKDVFHIKFGKSVFNFPKNREITTRVIDGTVYVYPGHHPNIPGSTTRMLTTNCRFTAGWVEFAIEPSMPTWRLLERRSLVWERSMETHDGVIHNCLQLRLMDSFEIVEQITPRKRQSKEA